MNSLPVTALEIRTVALTEDLLIQIPILKAQRISGLEYDARTNRAQVESYEGWQDLDVVGYVWRPDSVGHRACYWVIAKRTDGSLCKVHMHSQHSRPGEAPVELRGMSQIFVVEPDGERCSSTA